MTNSALDMGNNVNQSDLIINPRHFECLSVIRCGFVFIVDLYELMVMGMTSHDTDHHVDSRQWVAETITSYIVV